jgi:CHAT domain-containing protein
MGQCIARCSLQPSKALLFLLAGALILAPSAWADEPRPRFTKEQIKQLQEAQGYAEEAGKLMEAGKVSEAITVWKKKLAIERKIFRAPNSILVASLQMLAKMYEDREDYAAARDALAEVLSQQTKLHGSKHWQSADARRAITNIRLLTGLSPAQRRRLGEARKLNEKVLELYHQGKPAAALSPALEVVAVRKEILGPDHLDYAKSLNNLATIYKGLGEQAKAEALYKQVVDISKQVLGDKHPSYANSLSNLGLLYQDTGDYGKAEPLLQQALQIKKLALGEKHPEYAQDLNNLAGVYWMQADYAKAEPLFQKALTLRKQALGEKHPLYMAALTNLGLLYRDAAKYTRAESLLQRAVDLRKQNGGEKDPDYIAGLNHLASMYQSMGRYRSAEPLVQRALRSAKLAYGGAHPSYAAQLVNNASMYEAQGAFAKAEPLLAEAADIYKKSLGAKHPDYAGTEYRLAWVYASLGRSTKAADAFDETQKALHYHAGRVLPGLAEPEQLAFLYQEVQSNLHGALSLALARRTDLSMPAQSAAWLINAKALTADAVAEPALMDRDAADRSLAVKAKELIAVRQDLAELTFTPPKKNMEETRLRKLDRLAGRAERLARDIGRPPTVPDWVNLTSVRRVLPANAVLVDFAKVAVADFNAKGKDPVWKEARYVAWIVPATGKGNVEIVDLGAAKAIENAVADLYKALPTAAADIRTKGEDDAEKQFRKPLETLARLVLHPVVKHLAEAEHWIVSPDAALWHVPWAALPLADGRYAIERAQVSCVVSGRDLIQTPPQPGTGRPVVIADPDYDLKLPRTARDPAAAGHVFLSADKLPRFTRLQDAADQAKELPPLVQRLTRAEPAVLTGKEALESVLKTTRRPRFVALCTQSFYLEDQNDAAALTGNESGRESKGSEGTKAKKPKVLENALLRCGLALAGANHRDEGNAQGSNEGVLTGLDILGINLRGTDLVLLPDAATGPFVLLSGESMAGLRQAFQRAGAQTVLAASWQMSAADKKELFAALFDNLVTVKDKAKALRQAQLSIIKKHREKNKAAHPFSWAALSLTGRW